MNQRRTGRMLWPLLLAAAAAWSDGGATLVVSTAGTGAVVVVDGTERGPAPQTVVVNVPAAGREVRLELRLAGKMVRAASFVLAPGETLVWTGIVLDAEGQPVMPSGLGQTPAPQPAAPAFPPPSWPAYLRVHRLPTAQSYRVSAIDGMPQVLVPAGSLTIGSTPEQAERAISLAAQTGTPEEQRLRSETPAHQVFVSGYWMDLHEVTCAQYAQFLNAARPTDAERKQWVLLAEETKKSPFESGLGFTDGQYVPTKGADLYPVSHVTWEGAAAYARWAGRSLPSEAQWERAARAGAEGLFYAWPGEAPPPMVGNLCDATHVGKYQMVKKTGRWFVGYDDGFAGTSPVCSFQPNDFGLFDLMGNLWEWCLDSYGADYYAHSPNKDPVNTAASEFGRVLRGGAFLNAPWSVRPACRLFSKPEVAGVAFGFRCVQAP